MIAGHSRHLQTNLRREYRLESLCASPTKEFWRQPSVIGGRGFLEWMQGLQSDQWFLNNGRIYGYRNLSQALHLSVSPYYRFTCMKVGFGSQCICQHIHNSIAVRNLFHCHSPMTIKSLRTVIHHGYRFREASDFHINTASFQLFPSFLSLPLHRIPPTLKRSFCNPSKVYKYTGTSSASAPGPTPTTLLNIDCSIRWRIIEVHKKCKAPAKPVLPQQRHPAPNLEPTKVRSRNTCLSTPERTSSGGGGPDITSS